MRTQNRPLLLLVIVLGLAGTPAGTRAHSGHGDPAAAAAGCDLTDPSNLIQWLPPFQQKLPIPATIRPARTNFNYRVPVAPRLHFTNGIPEYDVPMVAITNYQFHPSVPGVDVWGYAGSYPGPSFDVEAGSPVLVNWMNKLPTLYPAWLPADTNLHGVEDQSVRTVVHLHGSASLPRYDGYPTNWFRTGESDQYFYSNENFTGTGATLWYHDHAVGVTLNNVYAGLAGFYLIRNSALEKALKLPKIPYEIPLVFQDRDISTNCTPPSLALGPFPWHNLPVVNGKVAPYFEVEPRKYRFRMLNGAIFRTFGLALVVTDTNGVPLPSTPSKPLTPPTLYVIGNDNGLLPKTVPAPPRADSVDTNNFNTGNGPVVSMMPGERLDAIIDFSRYTNQNITLRTILFNADPTNLVLGAVTNNGVVTPVVNQVSVTNLMQFRVTLPLASVDTSEIPVNPMITNWVSTATMAKEAKVKREITLDVAVESPFPGPPFNPGPPIPFALLDMKYFEDPTTEFPHPGDTEIWSFVNLSSDAHPMHIHLLDFRVLDRTRFGTGTTNGWNGDIGTPPTMVTNYINDRIANKLKDLSTYLSTNPKEVPPPQEWEGGPKDVVKVAPFSVTRIVMTWPTNELFFTTRSGTSPSDTESNGRYVYHCHLLDHEDSDMMRPLQLMPALPSRRQLALHSVKDAMSHEGEMRHLELGVETIVEERYQVESCTDLKKPVWTPVPSLNTVRGTGGFVNLVLPTPTDKAQYFRIRTL